MYGVRLFFEGVKQKGYTSSRGLSNLLAAIFFTAFMNFMAAPAWSLGSDLDETFLPPPLEQVDFHYINQVYPLANGQFLVAGSFSNISGVARESLARLNSDGSIDHSFEAPFYSSNVRTIDVQSSGKIIVAGGLYVKSRYVGGSWLPSFDADLVRLDENGAFDDSFNYLPEVEFIEAVKVLADDKIMIGGSFTGVNTTALSRIARLNDDGSLDTGFSDLALNDTLLTFTTTPAGKIYIGGKFTIVDGEAHSLVARLDADGTLDSGFADPTPDPTPDPFPDLNGEVRTIYLDTSGDIIIGGSFSVFLSNPTQLLRQTMRLSADGIIDRRHETRITGKVNQIHRDATGGLVIAGTILSWSKGVTGYTQYGMIRLYENPRDNFYPDFDTSFNPGFDKKTSRAKEHSINALVPLSAGKFLVAGILSNSGEDRFDIIQIDPGGSVDLSFNAGKTYQNGYATSMVLQADGKVLLGGYFKPDGDVDPLFGGTSYWNVIRLNEDGSYDAGFTSPGPMGNVYAIAEADNQDIYIGGDFQKIGGNNGVSQITIAKLNADGLHIPAYDAYTDGNVLVIHPLPGGDILVGGSFYNVNGQYRRGIARLNTSGELVQNFDAQLDGTVRKIVVKQNKIYIAGVFDTVGGQTSYSVARLNMDGSIDATFLSSQPELSIRGLAVQNDGKVVVGGIIDIFDAYFARLLGDGSVDTGFDPPAFEFLDAVREVQLQQDGKIIVSGYFSQLAGVPRSGFARFNTDGTLDTSFNDIEPDHTAETVLVQADGKILLAGNFQTIAGEPRGGVARLLGQSETLMDEFCFPIKASDGAVAVLCM